MEKRSVPLGVGGVSVPLGSHLAFFYRNREEQRAVVVPFIKTGLERGARCICIVDEETREGLIEALQRADVEVGAALASNQLSILSPGETYLSQGYFSPEKALDFWEAALRTTLEKGYKEIRITGDITWALGKEPGVERLMEYEAKVNQLFPSYPLVAICQYNTTRLGGDLIIDALKTHPDCILGGVVIHNHFYLSPEAFLRELPERCD